MISIANNPKHVYLMDFWWCYESSISHCARKWNGWQNSLVWKTSFSLEKKEKQKKMHQNSFSEGNLHQLVVTHSRCQLQMPQQFLQQYGSPSSMEKGAWRSKQHSSWILQNSASSDNARVEVWFCDDESQTRKAWSLHKNLNNWSDPWKTRFTLQKIDFLQNWPLIPISKKDWCLPKLSTPTNLLTFTKNKERNNILFASQTRKIASF